MSDRRPTQAYATLEDYHRFVEAHGEIDYIDAAFVDMNGILRGKRLPRSEAEKIFAGGVQMPRSITFFDITGMNEDVVGMGFTDGDPDAGSRPLAGTLVPVPWHEQPLAQVLMSMVEPNGEPIDLEPRAVLQRVLRRFTDMGLAPMVACELEFYLFDYERDAYGKPRIVTNPITEQPIDANNLYSLAELDCFMPLIDAIDRAAMVQHVPASGATTELGPGQYEINLKHEPDVCSATDHAVMLRHLILATARKHGYRASFMAKPLVESTGNGMHVHCSVMDRDGTNIFDNGTEEGSDALRFAIGGLQALLGPSMALFAPNVNSFRRFEANSFVPVNGSWGYNNRSVAFRVPSGEPKARRLEHRVAGADANPYLVVAAILAGIHYGLTQELDPGAPSVGNACDIMDVALPETLRLALGQLRGSAPMRNYLGDRYVDVYAEAKLLELTKFQSVITRLEYDWYL